MLILPPVARTDKAFERLCIGANSSGRNPVAPRQFLRLVAAAGMAQSVRRAGGELRNVGRDAAGFANNAILPSWRSVSRSCPWYASEHVQATIIEKFGHRNFVKISLEDNGAHIIKS